MMMDYENDLELIDDDEREILEAIDRLDIPPDLKASWFLYKALVELKKAKPNDRSDSDRRHAITITDFEKVVAYYDYYIMREG